MIHPSTSRVVQQDHEGVSRRTAHSSPPALPASPGPPSIPPPPEQWSGHLSPPPEWLGAHVASHPSGEAAQVVDAQRLAVEERGHRPEGCKATVLW
eukprot:2771961-Pleurochrysis_carterae.AAC.1